jgi:hypothetical protein
MTITIDTQKTADAVVGTAKLAKLVVSAHAHHQVDKVRNLKSRRAAKRYDKQIAASQAKIGPYKPATIPVQVWA